jgi:hypothetical protein
MLVAAAVCPHPPALAPAVTGAAATDLAPLRAACDAAVRALLDAEPARIVVVGDGPRTEVFPAGEVGSLRGYGVDLRARLGDWGERDGAGRLGGETPPRLPLSLTLGAWLLDRAGDRLAGVGCLGQAVHAATEPKACAELGARLVAGTEPVAMLVLGDGSACRGESSPGPADPRALAFDAAAGQALARADTAGLLALSAALAADLLAAGRASWQVLAGAAEGRGLRGRALYQDDPYGVAYHVATWR